MGFIVNREPDFYFGSHNIFSSYSNLSSFVLAGIDRALGGAERRRVHRGSEELRQHIATGSVVYNDARAH